MYPNLLTRLEDIVEKYEIDIFGIADANGFLVENYTGKRPQSFMKECRSVIVLGVSLPDGCIQPLPQGRAEYTNTMLAATALLRIASFKLAKEIETEGYKATIVPAEGSEFGYWYVDKNDLKGDVSIKYAAYLAGLGEYGINHLILTEKYGPRIRLMAVVTDASLPYGRPSKGLIAKRCKDCLKCVEICPSGAIKPDGNIIRERCRDYMFNSLGGLRCGLCVKACSITKSVHNI